MKFRDCAVLAIAFSSTAPLASSSVGVVGSTSVDVDSHKNINVTKNRYLDEDQPFQFSSSAHACLLAYDMVQCVGYNFYGQLGQSTSDTFGTPVLLNFPSSITAKPIKVVTGYDHTCTLFDDGHVWCNGSNGFGQLGNGGNVNSATPVQVKDNNSANLANVIDIEAGAYHNCAIKDTGAMYCWGFNNKGQLGMNEIMNGNTNEKKAVKMALSLISTCVITGTETNPSKSTTCVGKGFTSENAVSTTIDLVNDVRKLTAGSHHFCALLVGDTAKCWGANNAGQLGIGSKDLSPRYNTAENVRASSSTPILSNIADINAGYLSTCLVLANGSPMCFGNNRFYQLGIANGGTNELYPKALSIATVSGKTLVSIYVGEQTGHAIYDDDSIYSMGTNYGGTFGDGSTVSSRNVVGDVSGATTRQMEFSLGTDSPSNIPSLQPSSSPSSLPSDSPSDQPSSIPSSLPSTLPSSSPSDQPSSVPSSKPSDLPSNSPSDQPSSIPSSLPSALPSLIHSSEPSDTPSLIHSSEPSDTPSLSPSSNPSLLPSEIPSLQPSSGPSSIPSDLPSLSPSSNPSQDPYLLGDENSHITFDNVDFGSTNSVKGIKITYANGEQNGFGSMEIKLGDASGTTLAQFSPPGTLSWADVSNTMLIPFDKTVQLSGVNSLTFTTSETTAVMHLISYELIDLSERFTPFTAINATEVSNQSGIGVGNGDSGYFDSGDYFTYNPVDFGLGANSIKIIYAKGTTGGSFEIWKGDHQTGEIIGTYSPASTDSWGTFVTVEIPIKASHGIDQLTFRGTGIFQGIMNLKSFQLSPVSAGYICLDTATRNYTASVQAAAAAQIGANLVSIQCGAQQNAVASLSSSAAGGIWIGGTDTANEGTWVLPDGNAMTYSNWNTGEPNNAGGDEDCIVFDGSSGVWLDGPCGTTGPAIFESTFAIGGLTCNEYVGCQDTVKIVENGIQTSDVRLRNNNLVTQSDTAGPYLNVPGNTIATSADNWNVYNLPIGANDDFVMLARLKVDGSGSAASFFINDLDNFGFDGSSNQIFTHSNSAFITGFVQSNKGIHHDNLFYFKVERKLGTIKFYINEEEVASTANYNVAISRFFWRPWRADLKIYDWIVSSPSLLDFSSIDQAGYVCLQTDQKTYSESVQAANSAQAGANLVSIRCSKQQEKVNLLSLGGADWIGANDINTENAWILADGHAMTYTNWNANEPSNAGGNEDCVVIGSDGLWNDGPCDYTATGAVYESPYPIDGLSCEQYAECTTNVALGGTATESSTAYARPASSAIDGNTASNFDSGSVTHTSDETDPWWKVQLAQEYSISRVIVYNRSESNAIKSRLNAFRMTVLLNEVEVFRYDDSAPLANLVTSILVPPKVIGDAVKIQLFGDNRVLSLAEVEVEGLCLHWAQAGSSIIGKATSDFFGTSMSLSADGRTVAVGAYGNDDNGNLAGQNSVFRLSHDGLWIQLGEDLNGSAANHESGQAIALSPDGSTVAIGDPLKDSPGYSNNGDVRIFRFNESTSTWELQGTNTIVGQGDEYRFGWERGLALSEDGNTVAVSAWYDTSSSGKGRVYVYRLTNGSWTLFGMSSPLLGEQDGDRFGYSVALSYDGETLAVGAPKNVNSQSLQTGHIRVYRISSGSWQLLGANLEGEGAGNMFGHSVSLSSNGDTVAIGGYNNGGSVEVTGNALGQSGHVRVLRYLNGSWQAIGEDIDGEAAYDQSGFSIALSSDGETVVIGANLNDGGGSNSGHARVYRYSSGSSWKKIGADIDGIGANVNFGRAVGISANGETVAISSRSYNSNTGYVSVYDLFGNCS